MTGEASRDVQQDLDTSDISGTGMAAWDGLGVHDPVDNTNIILNDVEMTVKSNQEGRKSGGETGKSSHETGKTSLEDTLKSEAKALMGNVECDNEGEGGAARVPDGGWGWLVVFGSFIITLLVPLLGPCFGVLFSSYLLEAGSSSATTAWIFNVQCFIWNMMGLIVRPLVKEFGWRNIAFQGILLTSASVIMSAFAPSPVFLFFSFSLLSGLGGGLAVCMSFILVPMYFDRRRGLANAIMMAGVCTGQIVGPPFVRLLQEQYTYKGATLILGAIMLNGLVGAAFYHPVEWHMKPARNDPLLPKVNVNSLNDGDVADETSKKYFLIANGEKEPGWSESLCRVRTLREDGTYQSSECLKASHTESVTLSLSSLCKPALSAPVSQSAKERVRRNRSEQVGFATLILSVARNTINNLKIFRSPRAVIISFGCTFFLNGYYNFLMMVPFAMQASGRTLQDSAWCISVSGVCHLVARTLISVLSDWSRFNMRLAYMAGLASTAFTILVFPLLLEFELRWLMVTMAVWGCGIGTTMGLYTLVMIKFMGLENLGAVYGASSLTVGFGFLSIGPLIELDVTKDDPELYAPVNIGFPTVKTDRKEQLGQRLQHIRVLRENPLIEKKSRIGTLEADLEKVQAVWETFTGPHHIRTLAEHYGIFRDLYGNAYFIPSVILKIFYDFDEETVTPVYRGNTVKPREAAKEPMVEFQSQPDDLWTLILTNPDGNLLENETECLHWFIGNIKGGDITTGEVICDYLQPFPPRGTGYHRLVFVLYKQDGYMDYSTYKKQQPCLSLKERTFSTLSFYRELQDNITPAGLSWFQSDWDSSLTDFFHHTLKMREPVYEYDFPKPYLAPQKYFPLRRQFNTYLDLHRDPKEINKEILLQRLKNLNPLEPEPPVLPFPGAQSIPKDLTTWERRDLKRKRLGVGKYRNLFRGSNRPNI